MGETLHILNGHSTLYLFRESGIEGDIYVWNEILSEGPVSYEVGSKLFWELRDAFITKMTGQDSSGYDELISGFDKVRNSKDYDEICLLYTSPSPRDLSTSRMPSSA